MPPIETSIAEANQLHQAGRFADAERGYRAVLAQIPDSDPALHGLGIVLARTGRFSEAVGLLERAIAVRGTLAAYHADLGAVLALAGRPEVALAAYRRALALAPRDAQARRNCGTILLRLDRVVEAMAEIRLAAALAPGVPENHVALAEALLAAGDLPAAETAVRKALDLHPTLADAHLTLGTILRRGERLQPAIAAFRQALALNPGLAAARLNLGHCLVLTGAWTEACACYRAIPDPDPHGAHARAGEGNALAALGRFAEAHSCFDRALAGRPDDPGIRWNRALALLADGAWSEGWDGFETRLQRPEFRTGMARSSPPWQGEPLAGQTILLHAEQGLGDTLHFVRYVPLVAARGGRVVLEVQPSLVTLMARLPGPATVVAQGNALPAFDRHCPLLSLPRAFATTRATVPSAIPYLTADPARVAAWRPRIDAAAAGRLKVGLVWAGNPRVWDDALRSPRLPPLLPLLEVPGVCWFSLQQGDGCRDLALPAVAPWRDRLIACGPDLVDFDETAAVMENLDLVISSCTAPAHLAGALGRPVWLLLGPAPDWRWLRERTDTPWYPTMRLFRQPTPGTWDTVVQAVRRCLAEGSFVDGPGAIRHPPRPAPGPD